MGMTIYVNLHSWSSFLIQIHCIYINTHKLYSNICWQRCTKKKKKTKKSIMAESDPQVLQRHVFKWNRLIPCVYPAVVSNQLCTILKYFIVIRVWMCYRNGSMMIQVCVKSARCSNTRRHLLLVSPIMWGVSDGEFNQPHWSVTQTKSWLSAFLPHQSEHQTWAEPAQICSVQLKGCLGSWLWPGGKLTSDP